MSDGRPAARFKAEEWDRAIKFPLFCTIFISGYAHAPVQVHQLLVSRECLEEDIADMGLCVEDMVKGRCDAEAVSEFTPVLPDTLILTVLLGGVQ